jgi:hypothetical protein
MAKQFARIEAEHHDFISRQKVFFTASAAPDGRVNVSPRETGSLRLIGPNCVAYLDLTGSGSETAAHLRVTPRLTLMFCAFEGPPRILRLYGQGRSLRRGSAAYAELLAAHYANEEPLGARQIVLIDVDLVQTSCGYGVPLFDYRGERPSLQNWAQAKGEAGLEAYRRQKNMLSIDGLQTGLCDEDAEGGGWDPPASAAAVS